MRITFIVAIVALASAGLAAEPGPAAAGSSQSPRPISLVDAAAAGDLGSVRRILATGTSVDEKEGDGVGATALMRASLNGRTEVVRVLLAAGANPNLASVYGDTALVWAAKNGHADIARLLIERGADVNAGPSDESVLMSFANLGGGDIVRLLLEKGAKTDVKDVNGKTALMKAAGQPDTSRLLVERGADVNATDAFGETALMEAARLDSATVVRLLLDKGAHIDQEDRAGSTALMYAAEKGSASAAVVLLDRGARITNSRGLSALDVVPSWGGAEVEQLLRARAQAGRGQTSQTGDAKRIADPGGGESASSRAEALALGLRAAALVQAGRYADALPLLARALQIEEKISGPDDPKTAQSLAFLAATHVAAGSLAAALPLYQRALLVNEKALGADHPATVEIRSRLAEVCTELGLYGDALAQLRRVLVYQEKALGPDHPSTASSYSNLAGIYLYMGSYADALRLFQRVLVMREKVLGPEHPDTAIALNNVAAAYSAMGSYADAVPLCQRAVQIQAKASIADPGDSSRATSLGNLAMLRTFMGEYEEAYPIFLEAIRIMRVALGADHLFTARLQVNLGGLLLAQKRYAEAEAVFREAESRRGLVAVYLARGEARAALALLDAADATPAASATPESRIEYFTQVGRARQALGRRVEAADALRQAVEAIEDLRGRTPGDRPGFFTAGGFVSYVVAYRALASVLVEMSARGEALPAGLQTYGPDAAAAAFQVAEAMKARTLLETMAGSARRAQDPTLPPAIRDEEASLTQQLGALEAKWEQAYQGGAEIWQAHQARRAGLRQQLDALIVRLRRDYPLYAALHYPRPIPARDVPLKADEVLLEYAIGDEASAVIVVRPGRGPTVVRIPLGREALEAKVQTFVGPLVKRGAQGVGFSTTLARELYDLLLAGALADVPADAAVLIVPDGILGLLPFEALAVEAGTTLEQTLWVGDRFAVRYYQSATVLALQRQIKDATPSRLLFALGNPVFANDDPRALAGGGATSPVPVPAAAVLPATPLPDRFAFEALATRRAWGKTTKDDPTGKALIYPPLPETATEVQTIAGMLGVPARPPDVLLGLQANETELRKVPLGDYRYLHFATHADLPGHVQGINEPFLLLGQVNNVAEDDGLLTLSEVLRLKLSADLVVLSACVTGQGAVMEGEGVVNFARAFEQAGARAVVVSLWEVASAPAVEFMTRFYQALHAGHPPAAALRTARDAIKAKYPNPYFWAVFILHGDD